MVAVARAREVEAAAKLGEVDRAQLKLLDEATDPLEIARAMVRLLARNMGRDVAAGRPARAEELKKALQELTVMENRLLELAERRGDLIPLEVARAMGGQLGLRMTAALERLETSVVSQVEGWLGDSKVRELPAEVRGRAVREWFRTQVHAARNLEADDVDQVIEEQMEVGKGTG